MKYLQLSIAALFLMSPFVARADLIYFESFDDAVLGPALGGSDLFNATELEGGEYFYLSSIPDWTVSTLSTFVHVGDSGNKSVLLNSTSDYMQTTVSGLVIGREYEISLRYWADNEAGFFGSKSFDYIFGSLTGSESSLSQGLLSGNSDVLSLTFTAESDSLFMYLRNTSGRGTVFDDISLSSVSVPEPGTLALLGIGLAGIGAMRRRKAA